MKKCSRCKKFKSEKEFVLRKERASRRSYCYSCNSARQRKNYKKYKNKNPFGCRAVKLKAKCKLQKIKYNLTPEYLESIWNDKCPVFGIKISFHNSRFLDNHAELDRINPTKGYTIGNVVWISKRANRIKSDASAKELLTLGEWLKNVTA